jgi:DNA-binding response OmpR family regulator
MTQKQFNTELRALERRIARLRAVERGDATIHRVRRKGYRVRAHNVRAHWMNIVRVST